jgi:hypothetical protein
MKNKIKFKPILILISLILTISVGQAKNQQGRLGVGINDTLANNTTAISFKLQRSDNFSIGALAGLKYSTSSSGYGFGLKFYRLIFDEPNATFYMMGAALLLNSELLDFSSLGFQIDGGLGTEIYLSGLESVGFSFEFGLSIYQYGTDFTFTTMGNSILKAGIHFYL